MGAYDLCKKTVLRVNPFADEGSFSTKLTAGMASGMIGAAVANPADLVSILFTLGAAYPGHLVLLRSSA